MNNSGNTNQIILALDTSSKTTSIAVGKGSDVLASLTATLDDHRSEKLWTEIQVLLGGCGLSVSDIDAFAVCIGPGGFTGLRVGIAAAKGFAIALEKPLIGVSTLEAVAFAAQAAEERPAGHQCLPG